MGKVEGTYHRIKRFLSRKWALVLVLIAGLSLAGYVGHLLVDKRIGNIPGWVMLGLTTVLVVWTVSLLRRRWRVKSSAVFGVALATALLASTAFAYGDIAPFCNVKESIAGRLTSSGEKAKLIGIHANFMPFAESDRLVVELKPTSSTQASVDYVVKLYEKGKYRDSASLIWTQAEVNVASTKYVYFWLSNTEYAAYDDIVGYSTDMDDYGPIMRDLRDIFSVKVVDPSDADGANEAVSVVSLAGGYNRFGLISDPKCYIEGTLRPTSLTEPDREYRVVLVENILLGQRITFSSRTVSWSQREKDLKETKKVLWYLPDDKGALYNLDFYGECWIPFTAEERAYSEQIQNTIREHFALDWR